MRTIPAAHGTFRADDLRPGDPYELSSGHVIECLATGGRGSKAEGAGYMVIESDPDVEAEVETLRSNLLAVFAARCLDLRDDQRATIAECSDPERLRRWLIGAATAASAREALESLAERDSR